MGQKSIRFELSPTGFQKDYLIRLFFGPELLLTLLESEKNAPKTSIEIKLFLLKNKVQLYPYLCEYLHNNVSALTEVVKTFINSEMKY
jgi:hypothetical protein